MIFCCCDTTRTGTTTSGSTQGSYLESQMSFSFLYNKLNTSNAMELHEVEKQLFYESRSNWLVQESLKRKDQDLYVQSLLARVAGDREYAGLPP